MLKLTNKTYDILKYIHRIALPAIATFLTTVLGLANVPSQTIAIVVGVVTAVDTLMAALLQLSSNEYNKLINGEDLEN